MVCLAWARKKLAEVSLPEKLPPLLKPEQCSGFFVQTSPRSNLNLCLLPAINQSGQFEILPIVELLPPVPALPTATAELNRWGRRTVYQLKLASAMF